MKIKILIAAIALFSGSLCAFADKSNTFNKDEQIKALKDITDAGKLRNRAIELVKNYAKALDDLSVLEEKAKALDDANAQIKALEKKHKNDLDSIDRAHKEELKVIEDKHKKEIADINNSIKNSDDKKNIEQLKKESEQKDKTIDNLNRQIAELNAANTMLSSQLESYKGYAQMYAESFFKNAGAYIAQPYSKMSQDELRNLEAEAKTLDANNDVTKKIKNVRINLGKYNNIKSQLDGNGLQVEWCKNGSTCEYVNQLNDLYENADETQQEDVYNLIDIAQNYDEAITGFKLLTNLVIKFRDKEDDSNTLQDFIKRGLDKDTEIKNYAYAIEHVPFIKKKYDVYYNAVTTGDPTSEEVKAIEKEIKGYYNLLMPEENAAATKAASTVAPTSATDDSTGATAPGDATDADAEVAGNATEEPSPQQNTGNTGWGEIILKGKK